VDFWDLTKVLLKRWYFALPLLLVSMGGVLATSETVKPDYSAAGHVQLIPGAHPPEDPKVPRVHNPWDELGFGALGTAVIIKVEDAQVAKDLVAAGLTDSFTVTIEYGTSFFSIEAVGSTAQQATGTVQRLMKIIEAAVIAEQARFNVSAQDMITTLPLDKGDKVTVVSSKVKRVLLVAAGVGFLLTAGITIGLDALLRRRARRRAGGEAAEFGGPMPVRPVVPPPMPTRFNQAPPEPGFLSIPTSPAGGTGAGTSGQTRPRPAPAPTSLPAVSGGYQPVNVEYRSQLSDDPVPEEPATATDTAEVPADATIVLPLSHATWAPREKKSR